MRIFFSSLLVLSAGASAFSATFSLTGTVRDSLTGELLAAANVRVIGTSRGTITNAAGEYAISLPSGNHRILFTMLGYAPDTADIRLEGDMRYDARMRPSAIVLPEVVVTSEDPAIGIMRKAIANKQRWIDRLHSYEMQAFTRQTVYRDSAVAAINESYTNGYWQQGDTLREVVTQRRQTANVHPEFNFASVGRILNFLDDRIRFVGFTFVGPTALDALEYYDYRLLRTRTAGANEVYDIRMIPRTRTAPLFEGTVNIAGGSYALVGVDVRPNAAFQIPLAKDLYVRYRQQFGLYESSYWMPADIRISAGVSLSIPGFSFPRVTLTQTSVISDYAINTPIPDSIFRRPRLVIDSSATRLDSSYWSANIVLPLDSLESRAYRTLDSTQSLDIQFRPGGAMMTIGGSAGITGTILSFADLSFNRVEGLHAGVRAGLDSVTASFSLRAGLAYGFSDRHGTYALGGTYYAGRHRSVGIGVDAYRIVDHIPDRGYYDALANSLSALLVKEDYRDYFSAEGWKGFVTFRPSVEVLYTLTYISEREEPLSAKTNFSVFLPSRLSRPNPAASSGKLSSLRLDVHLGPEPVPLDLVQQNMFDLSIEHSTPLFTGGDFDFTRVDGVVTVIVPTFGQSYLMKPGFRLRASGGNAIGALPVQRLFSVESSLDGFAPFGVMHGARPREFTGTGYVALNLEHNFRNIPLLALGIPFLYTLNVDLIAFGGAAHTWSGSFPSGAAHEGTYTETGFSVSRIFELLRADFAWRLSRPRGFYFTLGVATFL